MKIRYLFLTMVLILLFASSYFARPTKAQETPRRIEITAQRFQYEPSEVTLKQGEPVVIVLKSVDVTHGIHFQELGLQATIEKGGSAQLAFTPTQVGDFTGHCSVFCGAHHGTMALIFHVVE